MADVLQDRNLERFVRDFALFHQRFLKEPGAAARPGTPSGTPAALRASAARTASDPPPGRTA